jgi:hypothetical protein
MSLTMPVVSTVRSTPRAAPTVPIVSMPGVQAAGSILTVEADDAADHDGEQNERDDEALDQGDPQTNACPSRALGPTLLYRLDGIVNLAYNFRRTESLM